MKDMFEYLEEVPQAVRNVIGKFENSDGDYSDCKQLVLDLLELGWTCEYYLDAEPYNLRKLTPFDAWTEKQVDAVFNCVLDEMSHAVAETIRAEVRTHEDKIVWFIDQEEKFKNYLEN